MKILKNFKPSHINFYFDSYYGSALLSKLSNVFALPNEQVIVGYGIEDILRTIFDSLSNESDSVLTHELHYTYYDKYLTFKKIKVELFKLSESTTSFEFDIEDCLNQIKFVHPKIILVTSPNNPTGNSIAVTDLKKILAEADKSSLVILDEAYYGFDSVYDEKGILSLLGEYDNFVILRSFSKLYALAGMRIGFALCGKKVREMIEYQDPYLGGSRILEEVAIAALESKEYYANLSNEIIQDRENFTAGVNSLSHFKAYTSRANFVLVKVSDEAKLLMETKMEQLNPLIAKFVTGNYMRLSIGTEQHTQKFLEVLSDVNGEV